MSGLVLSLFPGIGLLDRGFEEAGFTVVRGPDVLWGGDVKRFHPPSETFSGIIGGPPCQANSILAELAKAQGHRVKPDLLPDFERCVEEAQPDWFLCENTYRVRTVKVAGYQVHRLIVNNRWIAGEDGVGQSQSRKRCFQFGSHTGARLSVELAALDNPKFDYCVLASEGKRGAKGGLSGTGRSGRFTGRNLEDVNELQGLPRDFLADAPFTKEGKFRVVGNGVPFALALALALAVRRAIWPAVAA